MDDNDDFILDDDDFLMPKKKKINSGGKGKRREREIAKVLNDRFGGGFSRSVGSGNRWSQVANLPKHAQDTFSGDLVTPEHFGFTIESKGGYDDVDLVSAFEDGHAQIDEFLKQAQFDADRVKRKPIVVWKKSRKPLLAIIKTIDLPNIKWDYHMTYKDWSIVWFDILLKEPDSFWFMSDKH